MKKRPSQPLLAKSRQGWRWHDAALDSGDARFENANLPRQMKFAEQKAIQRLDRGIADDTDRDLILNLAKEMGAKCAELEA